MKPCPYKLDLQCRAWQSFGLVTTVASFVAGTVFCMMGVTGWSLVLDVCIIAGATTCVFWWIWVLAKIREFAAWWAGLHHRVEEASQLLAETKTEISEIKKITKQDTSLFG
jgi:hypothetical protein